MKELATLQPYLDFVRPYYQSRDSAHGMRHVERLIANAVELARDTSPAARTHVLWFICCFHGLSSRVGPGSSLHGEAVRFLRSLGWSQEEIEAGFESLTRHATDPQEVEELIVHDANMLERVGALGIGKAFTTGGARGQSIEETADLFARVYLADADFRTEGARRLAGARMAYTRGFLERLADETGVSGGRSLKCAD